MRITWPGCSAGDVPGSHQPDAASDAGGASLTASAAVGRRRRRAGRRRASPAAAQRGGAAAPQPRQEDEVGVVVAHQLAPSHARGRARARADAVAVPRAVRCASAHVVAGPGRRLVERRRRRRPTRAAAAPARGVGATGAGKRVGGRRRGPAPARRRRARRARAPSGPSSGDGLGLDGRRAVGADRDVGVVERRAHDRRRGERVGVVAERDAGVHLLERRRGELLVVGHVEELAGGEQVAHRTRRLARRRRASTDVMAKRRAPLGAGLAETVDVAGQVRAAPRPGCTVQRAHRVQQHLARPVVAAHRRPCWPRRRAARPASCAGRRARRISCAERVDRRHVGRRRRRR